MTYANRETAQRCANPYCLESFSGNAHANFCSTACRVQFSRLKKGSDEDRSVVKADAIRYLREYRKVFNDALFRCVDKISAL